MRPIKVSEQNRSEIQALIIAAEVGTNTGKRNAEDLFSACRKAEEAMYHEVAYNDRAGAVLTVYPAKERTETCCRMVRRKTGWFVSKIWRETGTVAHSGVRLILPPDAHDYGRRI